MEKIFVKGLYNVLGKIATSGKEFHFSINIPNKSPITLNITPDGSQIESSQEVEVSKELLKKMEENSYNNLPKELDLELKEI